MAAETRTSSQYSVYKKYLYAEEAGNRPKHVVAALSAAVGAATSEKAQKTPGVVTVGFTWFVRAVGEAHALLVQEYTVFGGTVPM